MLPWQVPMVCRMSCSSLTAAAASSPQLMSGSITSSIRPTPATRGDRCVSHRERRCCLIGSAFQSCARGRFGERRVGVTCSVEVDERVAAEVVVQTLAAVLLQLDLLDPDSFLDHLLLSLSAEEAVQQLAVHGDGLPLLSDLVSGLAASKRKEGKFTIQLQRRRGRARGVSGKKAFALCTCWETPAAITKQHKHPFSLSNRSNATYI